MNTQRYREEMEEIRFSDSEKESLVSELQEAYRKRTESKRKISFPGRWIVCISVATALIVTIGIGLHMRLNGTDKPQTREGYRTIGLCEVYENGKGGTVQVTEISLCENIAYQGADHVGSFLVFTLNIHFRAYCLQSEQVVLTYLLYGEWNAALLNTELTAMLSDIGIDGNAKDVAGEVYLVFSVSDQLKNGYNAAEKDTGYWGSEMKLTMNGVSDEAYGETFFKLFYGDIEYTDVLQ